jgi:sec-independent protein translocase protein TatB
VFNLSGSEIIFLIIIALVVLGPDKLPEAMRKAGKAYGDFKRMTSGFQNEMKSVLDEPLRELRETAELAKGSATFDTSFLGLNKTGATATGTSELKPQSGTMAPVSQAETPPFVAVTVPTAEPDPPADLGRPMSPVTSAADPVVPEAPAVPTTEAPSPSPVANGDATSRRLARSAPAHNTSSELEDGAGVPVE